MCVCVCFVCVLCVNLVRSTHTSRQPLTSAAAAPPTSNADANVYTINVKFQQFQPQDASRALDDPMVFTVYVSSGVCFVCVCVCVCCINLIGVLCLNVCMCAYVYLTYCAVCCSTSRSFSR